MLKLPNEWAASLISQPETGMGYQVATVQLRGGPSYSDVVIQGGCILSVGGCSEIPFSAEEIASIKVSRTQR